MRTFSLLCLGLAALTPTAANAEWLSVGRDTGGSEWFVDFERMRLVSGKRQAWVQVDHSKNRSIAWRESMRLLSFDCDANTYKLLSYVDYDSYGKTVDSGSNPNGGSYGYEPVIPESMGEAVAQYACMTSDE